MSTQRIEQSRKERGTRFVLPDPPPRLPEDMTSFKHLTRNGSVHYLIEHLGNQETTIVEGERHLIPEAGVPLEGRRYPDLMIALNADPQLYQRDNGYVIANQGKPPDFVLEVASPSTGRVDVREKREYYASMGVTEYWRFDETGQYHGTPLAGDRLAEGQYQPIATETLEDGTVQGYSEALDLILRWENGELIWYDPRTESPIDNLREARARERAAETRAEAEAAERAAVEARNRELEAELARRNPNA